MTREELYKHMNELRTVVFGITPDANLGSANSNYTNEEFEARELLRLINKRINKLDTMFWNMKKDNEPLEYYHTEIYDNRIGSNENMLLSIRNYHERIAKLLLNKKEDTNVNEFKQIIIEGEHRLYELCIFKQIEKSLSIVKTDDINGYEGFYISPHSLSKVKYKIKKHSIANNDEIADFVLIRGNEQLYYCLKLYATN